MTGGPGTSASWAPLPSVTTPRNIVRSCSPSLSVSGVWSWGATS